MDEKIKTSLLEIIKDNKERKIYCKQALELSRVLQVEPSQVGKSCNELKIKVMDCQLGCFE